MADRPFPRQPPANHTGGPRVVPGDPSPELPADLSSNWAELRDSVPDIGRLLRDLMTDVRVPWHAKALSSAALGYAVLPIGRFPGAIRGLRFGVDDLAAGMFAVRHLIAAAGYDVVRERWRGTDDAFGLLVVLAGVHR